MVAHVMNNSQENDDSTILFEVSSDLPEHIFGFEQNCCIYHFFPGDLSLSITNFPENSDQGRYSK
jgi:hypothetical protein